MKKGQIVEGFVKEIQFPNKGIVVIENETKHVTVKDVLQGQKVSVSVNKIRKGKAESRLMEVLEKSVEEIEPMCPHFKDCGGCTYQNLPYEKQLELKAAQVKALLDPVIPDGYDFLGIKGSTLQSEYRNKMEFSFGDEYKDGPLALGMHKRGSFYDIVTVPECQIVDPDFRQVLMAVLDFYKEESAKYLHKLSHQGYLRHLLVRRAVKTKEILINLVTSSQTEFCKMSEGAAAGNDDIEKEQLDALTAKLTSLPLTGRIAGILHTVNDSLADIIQNDRTDILYGEDYFYEEIIGLKFRISPFSFFQTNSLGAEVLYETAREYVGETKDKIIRFGVDSMVYISCKPTSLARDLEILQARGYKIEKVCCVDMFPGTVHVETVCSLHRIEKKNS